jgi:hypothetical protein
MRSVPRLYSEDGGENCVLERGLEGSQSHQTIKRRVPLVSEPRILVLARASSNLSVSQSLVSRES